MFKRIIFTLTAVAALVGGAATVASASTVPANFPGNNGISCDAWHGAPGGLGINSPYYWVRSDPGFGQEQGVITGQNNSGFSAACNG
jgi:hypothetical protein